MTARGTTTQQKQTNVNQEGKENKIIMKKKDYKMETKRREICNKIMNKIRGEGKEGQQIAASKYIQHQAEAHSHGGTPIERRRERS